MLHTILKQLYKKDTKSYTTLRKNVLKQLEKHNNLHYITHEWVISSVANNRGGLHASNVRQASLNFVATRCALWRYFNLQFSIMGPVSFTMIPTHFI